MSHNIEKNKNTAIAFYQDLFDGNTNQAVEKYVGSEYIQHNPIVKDGKQAVIDYFDEMHRDYPQKSIKFLRSVAQGDMVALHTLQTWPGNEQYVTMDFYRFDDNGKIVEHWDAIQEVPESSKNDNTMY